MNLAPEGGSSGAARGRQTGTAPSGIDAMARASSVGGNRARRVDADTTAPLNSLPSFALSSGVPTSTWARKGNTKAYEDETREILRRPKTEELARAFGALFSLQGIRFITRGSLFIGDPWA
jgi:hypothetical protein